VICAEPELQVLKVGRFSVGWFMLAVGLVKGASRLLHIMGSNTMIFAVLKGVIYMSPLHCVNKVVNFLH